MEVFKVFIKIVKKNPFSMLLYIGIFMLLTFLNTAGYQDDQKNTNMVGDISIGIINKSDSPEAEDIVKYLGENFKIVDIKDNEEKIKQSLVSNYADYILKIDKNNKMYYYSYGKNLSEIAVNEKINGYMQLHNMLKSVKAPQKEMYRILNSSVEVNYHTGISNKKIEKIKSIYYYYEYLLYTITAIILYAAYDTQSKLKNKKILNRIKISGTKRSVFKRKLYFSYLSIVGAIWLIFTVFAVYVFGYKNMVELRGIEFMLSNIIYLIPISILGCTLSELVENDKAAGMVINAGTLILAFISGTFIPIKYFSPIMEKVAIISPMYWSSMVNNNILRGDFYSRETAIYITIEILMAITLFLVYAVLNKEKVYE